PRSAPTHTSTTHTPPLSLHDALPISRPRHRQTRRRQPRRRSDRRIRPRGGITVHPAPPTGRTRNGATAVTRVLIVEDEEAFAEPDRKSTRLNSSHVSISYAVFCLKKK